MLLGLVVALERSRYYQKCCSGSSAPSWMPQILLVSSKYLGKRVPPPVGGEGRKGEDRGEDRRLEPSKRWTNNASAASWSLGLPPWVNLACISLNWKCLLWQEVCAFSQILDISEPAIYLLILFQCWDYRIVHSTQFVLLNFCLDNNIFCYFLLPSLYYTFYFFSYVFPYLGLLVWHWKRVGRSYPSFVLILGRKL